MAKKQISIASESSSVAQKLREKKKWQIALRRYVLEKNPSSTYAPFFGLDIEKMREWFQIQLPKSINWDDFGKKWQFGHVVPATFFNFTDEKDLSLCWSFINLRAEELSEAKTREQWFDPLIAKEYFKQLYESTGYSLCKEMTKKIDSLSSNKNIDISGAKNFILQNLEYLNTLSNFASYEFQLLNSGRKPEEVKKEIEYFKKFQD